MTGIVPLSGTMQFDKDSDPPEFLNGGKLYIDLPTTTTPAAMFSDFAMTVPTAYPIILNSVGRVPAIYGADGAVRLRLLSAAGVLQFDEDNVALVTAAVSSTPITVTSQQLWGTGDVKVRYDDQPTAGFVRANGRTIGSATSGGSERANADCESLFKFLWTFANITLPSGKGASAAADWSANKQLTLPDMAGRLIGGRDDLGAGVSGRITSATVTGPTAAGAVGGAQTVTLDATMIPAHTHTFTGNALAPHAHTTPMSSQASMTAGATSVIVAVASTATSSDSAGTPSGTNSNTGGGLPHSSMPPVMLLTVYIKL